MTSDRGSSNWPEYILTLGVANSFRTLQAIISSFCQSRRWAITVLTVVYCDSCWRESLMWLQSLFISDIATIPAIKIFSISVLYPKEQFSSLQIVDCVTPRKLAWSNNWLFCDKKRCILSNILRFCSTNCISASLSIRGRDNSLARFFVPGW